MYIYIYIYIHAYTDTSTFIRIHTHKTTDSGGWLNFSGWWLSNVSTAGIPPGATHLVIIIIIIINIVIILIHININIISSSLLLHCFPPGATHLVVVTAYRNSLAADGVGTPWADT